MNIRMNSWENEENMKWKKDYQIRLNVKGTLNLNEQIK